MLARHLKRRPARLRRGRIRRHDQLLGQLVQRGCNSLLREHVIFTGSADRPAESQRNRVAARPSLTRRAHGHWTLPRNPRISSATPGAEALAALH
jgi:hypothetical protein